MKLTRKEFLNKILTGSAVFAFSGLATSIIESCNTNSSNPLTVPSSTLQSMQVTPQKNIITLTIDSASPLAAAGGAVLLDFSGGNILVDRTDQNSFNALSAVCTHQGCIISAFDSNAKQFICPCHGSKFNLTGQVINGPASRPLSQYQTSFVDNKLNITI